MSQFITKWYSRPEEKNKPEDEFDRDRILMQVYQSMEVGYKDDKEENIIVICFDGRCIIERKMVQGSPLVYFNWVSNETTEHFSFWMNESSVEDLFMIFKRLPKGNFQDLFEGK